MFEVPHERQFVARTVFERASSPRTSLDRVGALSEVKVTARSVRADPRLVQLADRLALRSGSTEVPVLSRQDILFLKPRLAVRSVSQFTRRLAAAVSVFVAAFWMAHLFRRWRRRDDDPLLLPALMLLCGIGLMTMCALRDPIRDTIAGGVVRRRCRDGDRSPGGRVRDRLRGVAAAARRAASAGHRLRTGGDPAALRQRARVERREGQPARRAAGRGDPATGRVRARRLLRPPPRAAARALGAGHRVAAMASFRTAAALARRAAGRLPAWRWSSCSSSFRRISDRHWCSRACSSACSAWRAAVRGWSPSVSRYCSPGSRRLTGRECR